MDTIEITGPGIDPIAEAQQPDPAWLDWLKTIGLLALMPVAAVCLVLLWLGITMNEWMDWPDAADTSW